MGRISLCVVVLSGCFFSGGDDGGGGYTRRDARPDACPRRVCSHEGASCGAIDDGCGGTLDCGTCSGLATCGGGGVENVCAIPAADRVCSDGWCWEAPAPLPFFPASSFAVTTTDVWTVGARGTVMHYDGTDWRTIPAGTTENLNDIWMASATDGWLVGNAGVIRRWNGAAWNPVASGTTNHLNGVHGTAANNVYIVGQNATKRWNGTSLLDAAVTPPFLYDVFIAGSNVFAVGEGFVWELVATTWTKRTSDSPTFTSYSLYTIGGTATNVFALGRSSSFGSGEDLGYQWTTSGGWTSFADPGDPEWEDVFVDGTMIYGASDESIATLPSLQRVQGPDGIMTALAATSGEIFVGTYPLAGSDQLYTGLANSSTWTPARSFGDRRDLTRVSVVGDRVWATGPGTVIEWNGGPIEHTLPTSHDAVAVGGSNRTDVWVATDWDTYHFDGAGWEEADAPSFPHTRAIVMIGAEPALVGEKVYTRAAGTWTEHPMEANIVFEAGAVLDGQLYIAGHTRYSPYESRVTRQTNGTWTSLPDPPMQQACGIAVIADNDIWVSGFDEGASIFDPANGIVAHWNGSTWEATTHTGAGELCSLALHGGELWVTGNEAALWKRSATGTWSSTTPARAGSIRSIVAQGTTLWAVGDFGAVLRRE